MMSSPPFAISDTKPAEEKKESVLEMAKNEVLSSENISETIATKTEPGETTSSEVSVTSPSEIPCASPGTSPQANEDIPKTESTENSEDDRKQSTKENESSSVVKAEEDPPEHENPSEQPTTNMADSVKSEVSQGSAPFHLLMLPASEHPKSTLVEPTLPSNRKLRRDYLSKRRRAYNPQTTILSPFLKEEESDQSTDAQNSKRRPALDSTRSVPLWCGATTIERALVDCCELPPTDEEAQEGEGSDVSTSSSLPTGGALTRGYEARFTALVAKHCQTYDLRVLALAILERTLEQDNEDLLESEREKELQSAPSLGEEPSTSHEEDEKEAEDNDDDWNPDEEGATRRSKRIQKRGRGRPPKRPKTKQNEDTKSISTAKKSPHQKKSAETSIRLQSNIVENETQENGKYDQKEEDKPYKPRMSVFFAAGGLKILKNWLMDAVTPVKLPNLKPAPGTPAAQKKTQQSKQYKPSIYGPTLLPLLKLLKDIPFDKNLVVESKINKQIRRLSKQVDGLVDTFKKQHKGKDAGELLKAYVDPGGGAGGLVVVDVQEAVNQLKQTWEDHAKKLPTNAEEECIQIKDPFEDIKCKLRERFDLLKAVEAGKEDTPRWLSDYATAQKDKAKKRRKIPVKAKKTSTQQLALEERESERMALKDKLKAAEEERKAHLERLKDLNSKRLAESRAQGAPNSLALKYKKKNGKSVKWKDGLSSDRVRRREILEQVFVLEQTAEKAPENLKAKKEEKKLKAEPVEEEVSPQHNDQHGLFEFDETLLL